MLRHVPCADEQGPTIYGATETGPDLQLHWTLVGALVVWGGGHTPNVGVK